MNERKYRVYMVRAWCGHAHNVPYYFATETEADSFRSAVARAAPMAESLQGDPEQTAHEWSAAECLRRGIDMSAWHTERDEAEQEFEYVV